MVTLLLENNFNLFPSHCIRLSRFALPVVNSKNYFPVDNKTDVSVLDCMINGLYWHQIDLMRCAGIGSFNQFYQSMDRLRRAGYIEFDNNNKLYHITLAGRYFLRDFNNTIESLLKADIIAIADALDNQ